MAATVVDYTDYTRALREAAKRLREAGERDDHVRAGAYLERVVRTVDTEAIAC